MFIIANGIVMIILGSRATALSQGLRDLFGIFVNSAIRDAISHFGLATVIVAPATS